ncbi:hypothetical protein ACH5RR_039203 [Cinchona calisaya]|uniref:HAT C-terminal dimerisation domain-containing protein n=1 Tax=Cinchona calisaya TaxID=153742 RepID=A0ABD2Y2U0_9GENT
MAPKTVYSYFNKRSHQDIENAGSKNSSSHTQLSQVETSTSNLEIPSQANASTSNMESSTSSLEQVPTKVSRTESKDFDMSSMERDPGKRMSIWNYSPDQQDECVAFRGHDETLISDNRGNFLTLLELLGDYNEQFASVILENAPKIVLILPMELKRSSYPLLLKECITEFVKILLELFKLHVKNDTALQNVSTISELRRELSRTGNETHCPLVDRLIRLVTTLPVSTASAERAFSVMKIIKKWNAK